MYSVEDLISKVASLLKNNAPLDALDIIPENLTDLNNNATLNYLRGNALYDVKRYDDAILSFSKAIELKKDYIHAYHNRAICWLYKKDFEKAILDYTFIINLKPSATIYNSRGALWDEIGNPEKAYADFLKAIETDSSFYLSYVNKGNILGLKNKFKEAIEEFNKALKYNPDCTEALYNRAVIWNQLNETDKAKEDLEKVIEKDPLSGDSYYALGTIFENQGEIVKAVQYFKRSVYLGTRYIGTLTKIFTTVDIAPYLLKRLYSKIILNDDAIIYSEVYNLILSTCKKWDTCLHYLNFREKDSLSFLKLSGYVNYWMGDSIECYNIFKNLSERNINLTARECYYLIQSAQDFNEPIDSFVNSFKERILNTDPISNLEKYYKAKILLLNNSSELALELLNICGNYAPALYLKAHILFLGNRIEEVFDVGQILNSIDTETSESFVLPSNINIDERISSESVMQELENVFLYYELLPEIQTVSSLLEIIPQPHIEFYELPKIHNSFFDKISDYDREIELKELNNKLLTDLELSFLKLSKDDLYREIFNNLTVFTEFSKLLNALLNKPTNYSSDLAIALFVHDNKLNATWYIKFIQYFYLQKEITIADSVVLYMYVIKISLMNSDFRTFTDSQKSEFLKGFSLIKISGIALSALYTYFLKLLLFLHMDLKKEITDDDSLDYKNFKENYFSNLGFFYSNFIRLFYTNQ